MRRQLLKRMREAHSVLHSAAAQEYICCECLSCDTILPQRETDRLYIRMCAFSVISELCCAQAPEPEAVNQFVWDLFSYLMQNPDKWVVVHCTHGFNRTGTLLAQYLIVTAMQHAQ